MPPPPSDPPSSPSTTPTTSSSSRPPRLDQLLSRCGYASRREAGPLVRRGRVTLDTGHPIRDAAERHPPHRLRFDGQPLEAPDGLLALFHKPAACVCSHDTREGPTIYDLLPPRWSQRNPPITSVGRLDRDTTGLLLITDLGDLVHRWTSPKHHVEKTYEFTVAHPLQESWIPRLAAGDLLLEGESRPCLPARLEILDPHHGRLILTEGRFHQVRRMFSALGTEVLQLHRPRFGDYTLDDLPPGQWRLLPLPA